MLLHLVDVGCDHAGESYKTIRHELAAYGNGLDEKAEIVALSKVDTVDDETIKKQMERLKRAMRTAGPALPEGVKRGAPIKLSAATNTHVTETLRDLARIIDEARVADNPKAVEAWQPLKA